MKFRIPPKNKKAQELEKLLINCNFRNNQNYILNLKVKNKIIQHAYTEKDWYYNIFNIYTNKKLKRKLYTNEIWYIKKWYKYKYNFYIFNLFIVALIWLFLSIDRFVNWEIKISIIDTTYNIYLITFVLFLLWIIDYFNKKKFIKNHLIFIKDINWNNIFLYKYKYK